MAHGHSRNYTTLTDATEPLPDQVVNAVFAVETHQCCEESHKYVPLTLAF